jgi:DNA-directed RNA polymerase subunit RPC12/RpoP
MIAALIVVGTVAVLATAGYFLLWRTGTRDATVYHYVRCPDCSQKVRYAAGRGGHQAICPRCKKKFDLPTTPQPLAKPENVSMVPGRGQGFIRRRSTR